MASAGDNYFSDSIANQIAEATRSLSSTLWADTVINAACGVRRAAFVDAPINYQDKTLGLTQVIRELSGIEQIKITECEQDFFTHPWVHSCVLITPGDEPGLIDEKTKAEIVSRSDLTPEQKNFAVIKECAHIIIRKAIADANSEILANWPNMKEQQLDIIDDLFDRDLLKVELDNEPTGLSPQKRAIWHLERKAARLALRIVVPKYVYKEFMLHYDYLKENETDEYVREWLSAENEFRLQLPEEKFKCLCNGKYGFLSFA